MQLYHCSILLHCWHFSAKWLNCLFVCVCVCGGLEPRRKMYGRRKNKWTKLASKVLDFVIFKGSAFVLKSTELPQTFDFVRLRDICILNWICLQCGRAPLSMRHTSLVECMSQHVETRCKLPENYCRCLKDVFKNICNWHSTGWFLGVCKLILSLRFDLCLPYP